MKKPTNMFDDSDSDSNEQTPPEPIAPVQSVTPEKVITP